MIRAYPLQWPDSWDRTPAAKREISAYKQLSFEVTRQELINELEKDDALDIVISTNLPLTSKGKPSVNAPEPEDPGVAVYWTSDKGVQQELACDRWFLTAENLRAVLKAVQAFRQLDRCGATQIRDRVFKAFAMLPPSSEEPREKAWWEVLGFMKRGDATSKDAIVIAYRTKLRSAHPDRAGGSHQAMADLNKAYAEAMKEFPEDA